MQIKKLTIDDMDLLIKLRIEYLLEDKKAQSLDNMEKLKSNLREYFTKWIPNNGCVAYIAEEAGEVYSTAFMSITERLPRKSTSYLIGTVYNVYTYPQYRKKGIATKVMSALLEEAKILDVAYVELLSTSAGKPLYKKIGFQEITEYTAMRFKI